MGEILLRLPHISPPSYRSDSGIHRKTQVPEEQESRFPGRFESQSLSCAACPPLRPAESETLSAGLFQCYGPGLGQGRWGVGDGGGVNGEKGIDGGGRGVQKLVKSVVTY